MNGLRTALYEDVKFRSIKEIEEEIVNQKAIVIKIGDIENIDSIIANEKAKMLEWVLGVR